MNSSRTKTSLIALLLLLVLGGGILGLLVLGDEVVHLDSASVNSISPMPSARRLSCSMLQHSMAGARNERKATMP